MYRVLFTAVDRRRAAGGMDGGSRGRADAEVMRRRRALEGAIVSDDPVDRRLDNMVGGSTRLQLTVPCLCPTRCFGET
jgi:hypothetical protein